MGSVLLTSLVRSVVARAGAAGALANVEADRAHAVIERHVVDAALARVQSVAVPAVPHAA